MKNIEALPLNKENFKDLFSLNFLIILVISFPSAIAFDLDPEFVSFHHIIRLLMILFTVPIMVKILNKKKRDKI